MGYRGTIEELPIVRRDFPREERDLVNNNLL